MNAKNTIAISLVFIISTTLQAFSITQVTYLLEGPFEIVARDGQYAYTKGGSERDMWTAWQLAKQEKNDEALEIINAYAKTLQRFEGHDAPLCAIQGYWLLRSMIILKNRQTEEWSAMIRRAFLPLIEQFEADSPYANGNWGHIVNRCRMAAAIFLDDKDLYQYSLDIYLHANDNGSLPHYISETGQCQETGRDQAHAQLGLGTMCDICEMAWQQGDDLWGALDNRLMKGMEYSARYNLGYDVPFETWQDCTGLYCDWTEPGSMQRGHIRCVYDAAYKHYTTVKALKMPYTKKLLELQRKAERRGEISEGMEARTFSIKGVKEDTQLHQIFTYPAPKGAPLKQDYEVFVRPRSSKEWTRVDTYMAKVNASIGDNRHEISEISYCMFDFTGNVLVRVVCKNKKYQSVRIRPDYRGVIARTPNDSTTEFMLFQPENISVEFDGDITNNLLLFTSKPVISKDDAERQAKADKRSFVYYVPGLYEQDTIKVKSNTTVYLDGGSYFTGTFAIEDAHDVSILGRGIARPKNGYEGCHVHRSHNIFIEGLTLNTCPIGGSDEVTLRNVRSISHPSWGDGLNAFASQNVLYDRIFCRNAHTQQKILGALLAVCSMVAWITLTMYDTVQIWWGVELFPLMCIGFYLMLTKNNHVWNLYMKGEEDD